MGKLPDLAAALQQVFLDAAAALARPSGFLKRTSKLSAAQFVQSLVFGALSSPALKLIDLAHSAALSGVDIRPQSLDERFTPASVLLMKGVLEAAVSTLLDHSFDRLDPPDPQGTVLEILSRFQRVELIDSSTIMLPVALAQEYPGSGGTRGPSAALKLDVRLDLCNGQLQLEVRPGCAYDAGAEIACQMLPSGSLWVQDLGYFALDRLQQIANAGSFWLTRYKGKTSLSDPSTQQPIDLLQLLTSAEVIDQAVSLGARKMPARLIAEAVSQAVAAKRRRKLRLTSKKHGYLPTRRALALCGWNVLLTNVPLAMLSAPQLRVVFRARWQIELIFKLWKSDAQIDTCRSAKPARVLSELYAKLIAIVLQHALLRTAVWQISDRSLRKAAGAVRLCAVMLLYTLHDRTALRNVLIAIFDCIRAACHLERRRGHPSTYQTILAAGKAP